MKKILSWFADIIRETDKLLLFFSVLAAAYGCLAVYSTTHFKIGGVRQIATQIGGMAVGLIAALVISKFNYKTIAKFWPLITGAAVLLVVLTFFIGYAPEGTDDKAWLKFFGLSFQPAELLKIAFAITFPYHIWHIEQREENINSLKNLLLLCLHGAAPVLLVHLQGDDGTAIVFVAMFAAMFFAAGLYKRYIAAAAGLVAVMVPVSWKFILNDAQKARIISLLNPEDDLLGDGWQQWRGRIAIARGGIFGQGYMKGSYVQSGSIPEGYNDFIFASIGEELGLLGCTVVLLLLAVLCIRILMDGRRAKDTLGALMCVGVFSLLASTILINVGMCLSLLPVVGVALPFFSAGGTNLLCTFLGLGLVLSVVRYRTDSDLYIH